MNTNHLSGKTAKRMTKATIETFIGLDTVYIVSLPQTTLENWVELLRKDGINSKHTVLDQIENILKGKN